MVYEELRGAEASIVGRGDRAIITVNRASPRARQRLAAAHELAHWVLDRGESAFVPPTPWGVEDVEWWDDEGEVDFMSPERRAEEWAGELLLPDLMLRWDLPWEAPLTFDTARMMGDLYCTPLLTTALRMVAVTNGNVALVRSRRGELSTCLRRSDELSPVPFHASEPRPGTVAHELLRDPGEAPGPTEVGSEAWVAVEHAWWTTLVEDSRLVADGEVWSLLWWPGVALPELADSWPDKVLALEPGLEAAQQLVEAMGREFGYHPVEWAGGELVMETREPSLQRVVIPDAAGLDVEGIRGLVAEVARQKGVEVDEVLMSVADWHGLRGGPT